VVLRGSYFHNKNHIKSVFKWFYYGNNYYTHHHYLSMLIDMQMLTFSLLCIVIIVLIFAIYIPFTECITYAFFWLIKGLKYSLVLLSLLWFPYIGYTDPDYYIKYILPLMIVLFVTEPIFIILLDKALDRW
jgi:hypothetical protein